MEFTVANHKRREMAALQAGSVIDVRRTGVLFVNEHRPVSYILGGAMRLISRDPKEVNE
jgi:hypothetical protein